MYLLDNSYQVAHVHEVGEAEVNLGLLLCGLLSEIIRSLRARLVRVKVRLAEQLLPRPYQSRTEQLHNSLARYFNYIGRQIDAQIA
jgi:hypothetical protein